MKKKKRKLRVENLESRNLLCGEGDICPPCGDADHDHGWYHKEIPEPPVVEVTVDAPVLPDPPAAMFDIERMDLNDDKKITALDALIAINHIDIEGGTYNEKYDVNEDYQNTALDALIIINRIGETIPEPPPPPPPPEPDPPPPPPPPPPARYKVTFRVANSISTVGYTKAQIMEAIELAFQEYEKVGDVDFQITNNGTYSISSDELWLGQYYGHAYRHSHARGWVLPSVGGRYIQIHNGKVKAGHWGGSGDKDWKAFSSLDSMKRVIQHEIGHAVMSWRHSSDPKAVMNINAGSGNFNTWEVDQIIRRWGRSKQ